MGVRVITYFWRGDEMGGRGMMLMRFLWLCGILLSTLSYVESWYDCDDVQIGCGLAVVCFLALTHKDRAAWRTLSLSQIDHRRNSHLAYLK